MKVIVASLGRCGSTMIIRTIEKSVGKPRKFVRYLSKLPPEPQHVFKTHAHCEEAFDQDYKVLFVGGNILGIIASLFRILKDPLFLSDRAIEVSGNQQVKTEIGSDAKKTSRKAESFMMSHLTNLNVKPAHMRVFKRLKKVSPTIGLLYMIVGDKFRFKENINSWKRAKNVLWIRFEEVLENPQSQRDRISKFLGVEINEITCKPRKSKQNRLPKMLKFMIDWVYKDFQKQNAPYERGRSIIKI